MCHGLPARIFGISVVFSMHVLYLCFEWIPDWTDQWFFGCIIGHSHRFVVLYVLVVSVIGLRYPLIVSVANILFIGDGSGHHAYGYFANGC